MTHVALTRCWFTIVSCRILVSTVSSFNPKSPPGLSQWNGNLETSVYLPLVFCFVLIFHFFVVILFFFFQFKFSVLFCGTGPFSSEDGPLLISENLEKRRSISKLTRDQIVEFSVLNKSGKHLLPRKWNLQKNVKQPPWVIDAEFRYSLLHWKFN